MQKGHNVKECGFGHKITTSNTIDIFLLSTSKKQDICDAEMHFQTPSRKLNFELEA